MSKLKARFCSITVRKNIMHIQEVSCFTHEIPIYRSKYGVDGVVVVKEDGPPKTKELGSVGGEYSRLASKHGASESGQSYVEAVYGNALVGSMAKSIGLPASDFPSGIDEDEYDELNKAPESDGSESTSKEGDETPEILKGLPGGDPSKDDLVAYLEDKGVEFDDEMNKPEMVAFAHSTLSALIKAASPKTAIPDTKVKGLMELLNRVTAVE